MQRFYRFFKPGQMTKIAYGGFGAFGRSISLAFSSKFKHDKNIEQMFFDKNEKIADYFKKHHQVPGHFSGSQYVFNDWVRGTKSTKALMRKANYLILGMPSEFYRSSMDDYILYLEKDTLIIIISKGLDMVKEMKGENEIITIKRLSEVVQESLDKYGKKNDIVAFAGGTRGKDVADKRDLVGAIAGNNHLAVEKAIELFKGKYITVFPSDDLAAIEYGGSLKNVGSIGLGMIDGLELDIGTKTSFFGGIYSEMFNLALENGAFPESYLPGNSALPSTLLDFILSSFSDTRNYDFGTRIGKNPDKTIEDILQEMADEDKTVEGYPTTKIVHSLAKLSDVRTPFMDLIYDVLYGQEVGGVMKRTHPLKAAERAKEITHALGELSLRAYKKKHRI